MGFHLPGPGQDGQVPVLWTIAGTKSAVKAPTGASPARAQLPRFEAITPDATQSSRRLTDVDQTDILSEAPHGSSAQTTQSHVHSIWDGA
jgi:hypothetical protein